MQLPKSSSSVVIVITIIIATICGITSSARSRGRDVTRGRQSDDYKQRNVYQRRQRKKKSEKPNIVIVMTDDQDTLLGSLNAMPKLQKILGDGGATFPNAFVSTPMCCPSRSSFLTGLYSHNHNVYTNNDNCSSIQWQQTHETRNFGVYLSNAGYRTGYFGKYLNEYNGSYIPPGWREWVGLIRNSRFYNYTINFNGKKIKHKDNYFQDYLTDLIANDSVTFLKQSKQYFPNRPVAMVLAMPAPHGPEDSAPQYSHMFENSTSHRTASWNYAPNLDKQWILQYTGKMEPIHIAFTDILQRKRLQTLQSVDDAVEKVYTELKNLGELDNTYVIFTSDHGYHLGQYGLIKGKAMPYEFDIRVPLLIRGPGIKPGMRVDDIALNIDLAPTILDMAGINVPEHMDGESYLELVTTENSYGRKKKKPWRDSFLVERGKVTLKKLKEREKIEAETNNILYTKEGRLAAECQRPEYQYPCKPKQKWTCKRDPGTNKLRMHKCRVHVRDRYGNCICPNKPLMDKAEKRNQRTFLKAFVNKPKQLAGKKFLRTRSRRDGVIGPEIVEMEIPDLNSRSKRGISSYEGPVNYTQRCRVLQDDTVECDKQIYRSYTAWKTHKTAVDRLIDLYKKRIEVLKDIRMHLKKGKPVGLDTSKPKQATEVTEVSTDTTTVNEPDGVDPSLEQAVGNDYDQVSDDDRCICDEDMTYGQTSAVQTYSTRGLSVRTGGSQPKSWRRMRKRDPYRQPYSDRPYKADRGGKGRKDKKRYRKEKRHRKKKKDVTKDCNQPHMNCFTHDNNHWKTAPFWNLGPFCFCPNSNNNTYWCVRTLNDTHNFLYCEFITGFISYYDIKKDPDQLRNAVHDLNYGVLQQLHKTLNNLRACKGAKECSVGPRITNEKIDEEVTENDMGEDMFQTGNDIIGYPPSVGNDITRTGSDITSGEVETFETSSGDSISENMLKTYSII